MKIFFGFFVAAMVLTTSAQGADFKIRLLSVDSEQARTSGILDFVAEIENADGTGGIFPAVRVKPFLVPSEKPADGRENMKGVGVDGLDVAVDFTASAKARVHFHGPLPRVPAGKYLLGAFVNSNMAVEEGDRGNNVSGDLLDVGAQGNAGANPDDAPVDFHSDTMDINATEGAAYHAWRLFWRGEIGDYQLYANFFFIDIENRKAYDGMYEKGVGLAHSGDDFDSRGRLVPYDVYGNGPMFHHAPSGNLYLMTWVNHAETYAENGSNNIDLQYFEVRRARLQTPSQGWFDFAPNAPLVKTQKVRLVNDYSANNEFQIDPASIPAGVLVSPLTGTFTAPDLTVTVDATTREAGVHNLPVKVISGGETFTLDLRAIVRTTPAATPAFLFLPGNSIRKTEYARTGFLRVTNPAGAGPLVFSVEPWGRGFSIGDKGTQLLLPGESKDLPVGIESRLLGVGENQLHLAVTYGQEGQTVLLQSKVEVTPPAAAPLR